VSVELRSADLGPSGVDTQLDATVSDGQSGTTSASFRGDVSATNEEAQDDNGDFGQSLAGERALGFRELELELLPNATRADLDLLVDHVQARFGLPFEPRGKKARGMALLDQMGHAFTVSQALSPIAAIEDEQSITVGV
jgi:hypothetical protein